MYPSGNTALLSHCRKDKRMSRVSHPGAAAAVAWIRQRKCRTKSFIWGWSYVEAWWFKTCAFEGGGLSTGGGCVFVAELRQPLHIQHIRKWLCWHRFNSWNSDFPYITLVRNFYLSHILLDSFVFVSEIKPRVVIVIMMIEVIILLSHTIINVI